MHAEKLKNNGDNIKIYFEDLGYEDVVVIKSRIPKYQKIQYEGNEFYLASSSEWQNAKQLKLTVYYNNLLCETLAKRIDASEEISEDEKEHRLEENALELFDMLTDKMEKNYSIFTNVVNKLKNGRDKFIDLSLNDKLKIILEILKVTQANASNANLKLIGGSDREGRLRGRENVDAGNLTFIYETQLGMNRKLVKY